jgi:hypothetical protein
MDEREALDRLFRLHSTLKDWPYGLSDDGRKMLADDLGDIWVVLHKAIVVMDRLTPAS